jgi:hypothetical protein
MLWSLDARPSTPIPVLRVSLPWALPTDDTIAEVGGRPPRVGPSRSLASSRTSADRLSQAEAVLARLWATRRRRCVLRTPRWRS